MFNRWQRATFHYNVLIIVQSTALEWLLMTISSRSFVGLTLACVLTTSAFGLDKPKAQPVDGKIKWVYDYEEGKRLSKTTGKPMFVVFRCER